MYVCMCVCVCVCVCVCGLHCRRELLRTPLLLLPAPCPQKYAALSCSIAWVDACLCCISICPDILLLFACVHVKQLLLFRLSYVCVQDKLAALTKFRESVNGHTAAACAVTVTTADWLTACLSLEDPGVAKEYCYSLACVAQYAEASGCDVIMSAGCIPIIVECLRRWPADGPEGVVAHACLALRMLAEYGTVTVHTTIKSVPGIKAMLVAAKTSRLDYGDAKRAIKKLGL